MSNIIGRWVGDPNGGNGSEDDTALADARANGTIEVIVEVGFGGYDWEEKAIARVGRRWYLVGASGCSCTTASEQWHTQASGSLATVKAAVVNGDYRGYTLEQSDFDTLVEAIEARQRKSN